jgi:hypothetical protein
VLYAQNNCISTVVESPPPAVPETRWLYTYDELVAEMAETNQPHELWARWLIRNLKRWKFWRW